VIRAVTTLLAVSTLVVCFYWKLTFTRGEYVWFDHPDMVYLELPRLFFEARELHQGRMPLWNPHTWMGQPLIGLTQPGPVNPFNLLMMAWPLDGAGYLRTGVLNHYFVLLHIFTALGAYALCRELRRSRGAALLGACAFSLGGFTGSVPWLDVLCGAIWAPWIAWFFLRAVRGVQPLMSAALGGVCLGLAWLSGHHELPLLTSLALAIAWAATRRAHLLPYAAVTFIIGALVAAVQMWPTIEFGRLSLRWGPAGGPVAWNDRAPYLSASVYSFTPRGMLGIVFPDQGTNADSSAFLGVVLAALALAGLASSWRHPAVRWLAALTGASLIYSMGDFTSVHGVVQSLVPGLDKARVPVRALLLFHLGCSVLATYGLDRAHRTPWTRRIAALLSLASLCVLLGALGWKLGASDALLLSAWISLAWCALIFFRPRPPHVALALLFMLTEMNTALTRGWSSRFDEKGQPYAKMLTQHRDIVEFLRREPGPTRVRVREADIPLNFGELHSIDMHEGYSAGVTSNLHRFGRHLRAAQSLLAVTHYVGREAEFADWPVVFTSAASGIRVYRNPATLPRVRVVHSVQTVPTTSHLAERIDQASSDLFRTALIVGNEALADLTPCAISGSAKLLAYAPNRVRIKAYMPCPGLVILADTHFPGWEASIDGKPGARIWEAYGALRGVVVGSGHHEIDFRYRPRSVYFGAALTAAGLLSALACCLAATLKKK